MLPWQWKSVHKKCIIWSHVVGVALLLHLFFAYLFFFYCRHGVTHILLTMKKNIHSIPVMFVQSRNRSRSKRAAITMPKVEAVQKKASVRKTSLIEPVPTTKKVVKKPAVSKKNSVKKEIKKDVPKKNVKKKEPVKQEAKPVEKKQESPIVPDGMTSAAPSQDGAVDYQQAELYALVAQQWAPPAGIAQDKICEVSAEIGWDQKITKVWISLKSGILMYDLAARKAVMQTQFPPWTRGKMITIRFVQ